MNKTILSISFILLALTVNATLDKIEEAETTQEVVTPQISDKNQLTFHLQKSFGFLWIFKYTDFVWVLVPKGTEHKDAVTQKSSVWYFWSGYFEKFTGKTYGVEVSDIVDGVAATPRNVVVSEVSNAWTTDYSLPAACEDSVTVTYKVVDAGWSGLTKKYTVEYTCNGKVLEIIQSKHENQEETTPSKIKSNINQADQIESEDDEEPTINEIVSKPTSEVKVQSEIQQIKPASKVIVENKKSSVVVDELDDVQEQKNSIIQQNVEKQPSQIDVVDAENELDENGNKKRILL